MNVDEFDADQRERVETKLECVFQTNSPDLQVFSACMIDAAVELLERIPAGTDRACALSSLRQAMLWASAATDNH